jgi:serine/threonine protein kinase
MSAVYKATDPNLKRVVAIKLIHPHLSSDPQFIQRFEEEAAAVASLRHPNIVQVYDFNSDQGVYYMVLEFVAGETLQDRLKRLSAQNAKLPIDEAIKYTLNICDALGYAHQRGMIHRDIKPANIMLDIYRQAILMDFGIVKIIGGTSHTVTGAVMGTARYISPEVIRAEQADPRSDIYSLGITLYEMLSGQAPFHSDSAMTLMMMHLNDPVPDPRSLRADIPVGLVNILLKSLQKDRTKRYQSAADMAADLRRELASMETGVVAKPSTTQIASPVVGMDRTRESQQPQYAGTGVNQTPPYSGAIPLTDRSTQMYNTPQFYNPPSTQYASIPAAPPAKKSRLLFWILGLGGGFLVLAIFIVAVGGFIFFTRNNGAAPPPLPSPTTVVVPSPVAVATSVAAVVSTIPAATSTPAPANTPAPTTEPTPTHPPLYVQINSISLNGSQYVVNYETFGYTEKLPGMHVHFFFNTVPPDQAGMPGMGPWYVYGGPRPFTKYKVSQRPSAATQMCALVAHADHSVIANSGNCVDLPN